MIKISEDIKKLYIEDSTPIELEVRFKDNVFPIINGSDVLSEQMTLHESICEEEQLKFGGCNASSFELTVFNLNSGIKGYEIEPVLITNKTEIPLGVFYVETIEKYAGKDYKKLTAYDKMRYFDVDVKDWYDNLTFPISVKNFRDGLCDYVGVEQNETTLITDNVMITKNLDSSNGINGLSLMKQICEISGVFGRMDRYGKFDYLSLESSMLLPADDLYPANDLYPSEGSVSSENSFNISTSLMYEHPLVEDFFTSNIDGVIIVDSDGTQVITENNQNPYYVQDNFVIMGQTHETIISLANALLSKISSISYRPINSSKIKGQPYVECGDFISGEVNGYGFEAYVFQRDLTGIKALRDAYICKGKELLENDMNGLTAQLQRLNKTTERVKTSVQVTEKGLELEVKRATDAENDLSTRIEQTEQQIVLRVDSKTGKIVQVSLIGDTGSGTEFKVDADNINLTASDVINLLSNGDINLTGKNITITSDNFNVDTKGNVKGNDSEFTNVKIKNGSIDITTDDEYPIKITSADGSNIASISKYGFFLSYMGTNLIEILSAATSPYRIKTGDLYIGQNYLQINGTGGTPDVLKLSSTGDISCKSLYQWSDEALKKDIESLGAESSDFIYSLRPVKYRFKENQSDRYHHGFIAQEVKESMGEDDWGLYVDKNLETGESGGKALRYEELIADLVATVQSQNERIAELENKLGGR